MLAAASIEVKDALFGFLARNDAECCKRELLGRSWRRDWGMHDFQEFSKIEDLRTFGRASKKKEDPMLGALGPHVGSRSPLRLYGHGQKRVGIRPRECDFRISRVGSPLVIQIKKLSEKDGPMKDVNGP